MNKKRVYTAFATLMLVAVLLLSACGEALPGDVETSAPSSVEKEESGVFTESVSSSGVPVSSDSPSSDLSSREETTVPELELTPEQEAYRALVAYVEENGSSCGGSAQMANGLEPSFLRGLFQRFESNNGAVRDVYIGVTQGNLCLFYDTKSYQVRVLFNEDGSCAEVLCHAATYRCTETLTCGKRMDPLYFNGSTEFFNGGPFSDYEPRYNMLSLLDKCDAILKEQGVEVSLKSLGYEHMNAEAFAIAYMY